MDRIFNRKVGTALGLFFLFAIWAFWPKYFSKPFSQADWRFHFHGLTLVAWCVLMVVQAYLIAAGKRPVHRKVGKLSYVVAPLVIVSTLSLAHYSLAPLVPSSDIYFQLSLPVCMLAKFSFAYGQAMYHRRRPTIHARFMVCTALVMITPIFDRILQFYLLPPEKAWFLPTVGGAPAYTLISFAAADIILLLLAVWDWRTRQSLRVFPIVLAVWIGLQGLTYILPYTAFWQTFTTSFLRLPLS